MVYNQPRRRQTRLPICPRLGRKSNAFKALVEGKERTIKVSHTKTADRIIADGSTAWTKLKNGRTWGATVFSSFLGPEGQNVFLVDYMGEDKDHIPICIVGVRGISRDAIIRERDAKVLASRDNLTGNMTGDASLFKFFPKT